MSEIRAVLLVPQEGDPLGLLRKTSLGIRQEASPPVADEWQCAAEACASWKGGVNQGPHNMEVPEL